ncbi:hypothetical protein DYB31_007216, partial [Aphanomyces astaci]
MHTKRPVTTSAPPSTPSPSLCLPAKANYDFPGNAISYVSSRQFKDCCAECTSTYGCNFYVWTDYNSGTGWLKSKQGSDKVLSFGSRAAFAPGGGVAPTCSPVEVNTDYAGVDIVGVAGPLDTCCDACKANYKCNAYSWFNGVCYLKGKRHGASPNSHVQTARVYKCAAPQVNTDYVGNDIGSVVAEAAEDCCAVCRSTAKCKAYSYAQGVCYLKSAKGVTKSNGGVTSASPTPLLAVDLRQTIKWFSSRHLFALMRRVDLSICDTTGSMGTYLPALKASLRQVFLVAKLLFHGRLMVHIVSYKDYCDANGLLSTVSRRTSRNDAIVKFVDDLKPTGGGDFPEAVKTALNHVIMTVDDIRSTVSATSRALVFLYTDAPPHHQTTRSNNQSREIEAIQDNPKYRGGHDWFQLQRTLQDLGIPVYTFHSPTRDYLSPSFYGAMGPTVILPQLSSTIITEATMGLLLQLMAQTFEVTIGSNFARSSFTHKGEPFDQSFSAQDETDIPPASSLVVTNETFVFAPLEWMKVDLNGLLPLFGRDADFRNLVMKTFEVIFRPENVLSVTYNPIFGKLWRLCCRQRLDPRLDDLTAKLSQCVPMLTGGAKVQVSEWLEESYNDSQRIRDAIANAAPLGPCFTLDIGHLSMSKASIRSLARAPQPGVLEGVQNILARLQYHQFPPAYSDKEDDDLTHLPLSLSNEDLFSFLPHLMFPGTTLSQRGAALVALVCCLSNHIHLINRAAEYLTLIQGTWLPFDYAVEFPEIFSAEFIQLLYRGQAYLTPFEQQVYRQLFVVHRLRLAATKDVDVVVGYTPQKDSLWPDRKARCHTCGYDTSLSLMVSPTLCAMCVTYGDDAPTLQANTVVSGNESHIVECHDCHGIYA